MKELSINDILSIEDKQLEKLEIKEWNGCIYIKTMSAKERSELEDLYMRMKSSKSNTGKFRKEMLRRTVTNSNGALLLSDDALAEHFMTKSSLVIENIFERACELNGFRERDVETIKKK